MTSATTPMLLSTAATLTPAMLMMVTSTISPSAQGSASVGAVERDAEPAGDERGDAHGDAVTATVCAISSHQPVCQASHGFPVIRPVIW